MKLCRGPTRGRSKKWKVAWKVVWKPEIYMESCMETLMFLWKVAWKIYVQANLAIMFYITSQYLCNLSSVLAQFCAEMAY